MTTTKRTNDKRISEADWKRAEPAINHLAKVTLDIAYAVLVEGKKQTDVAEEYSRTKQAVNNAVNRVWDALESVVENRLEHIDVWLPPEMAERVREMVRFYEAKKDK
ncbi:TPA: ArdK family transcriptional regulator [Klebsiella pneumoniae]|nr:ArdK family transcriptional regulator [Klebsiella pneumoniae]